MKNIAWISFFFFLSLSLAGQRNSDYGILAGVTSYMGDINPERLLYVPRPAGGFFYRYNLHPRQSIRADILFGGLQANDLDFSNSFQQARAASFRGSVLELACQFEFNFFNYSTQGKQWNYSPYFAAGIGAVFQNSTTGAGISSSSFQPVIPFSVGFKVNIHKNLGLEAEYGFRKTFYDNFDGLENKNYSASSVIHNNDWYSFTGLAVTWKIYSRLAGCPAFNDVDSKRKR